MKSPSYLCLCIPTIRTTARIPDCNSVKEIPQQKYTCNNKIILTESKKEKNYTQYAQLNVSLSMYAKLQLCIVACNTAAMQTSP
jgi:hypothetical protein